jgi:hypothetical protein
MKSTFITLAAVLILVAQTSMAQTSGPAAGGGSATTAPAATTPSKQGEGGGAMTGMHHHHHQMMEACKADKEKLCPGKEGKEVYKCMKENMSKTSAECQKAMTSHH